MHFERQFMCFLTRCTTVLHFLNSLLSGPINGETMRWYQIYIYSICILHYWLIHEHISLVQSLYINCIQKRTLKGHVTRPPPHTYFSPLPSGKRYRCSMTQPRHFRNSCFPSAIRELCFWLLFRHSCKPLDLSVWPAIMFAQTTPCYTCTPYTDGTNI